MKLTSEPEAVGESVMLPSTGRLVSVVQIAQIRYLYSARTYRLIWMPLLSHTVLDTVIMT